MNQKTRQAHLCHNVKLEWDCGAYVIRTCRASINEKRKRLQGDAPVQGKGIYGPFQSNGFVLNEESLFLCGPVSAVIKVHSLQSDENHSSQREPKEDVTCKGTERCTTPCIKGTN